MKTAVGVAAILLCIGLPAEAQTVQLRFHDGLVSLRAQNASLRAILSEWARVGGTQVLNAERLSTSPLTLELNAVTERDAINVLLRNVAGYMAAPRSAGLGNRSYFDRILILPTSTAPRNAPPVAPQRPAPPRPLSLPVMPEEPAAAASQGEPETPPSQLATPLVRPRTLPGEIAVPQPNLDPDEDPQPAPAPTNPFGIPASGMTDRPGVVVPAPQRPPQRTQPDPEP